MSEATPARGPRACMVADSPRLRARGVGKGALRSTVPIDLPDPATLRLRIYPDPILREVAQPVEVFDQRLRETVARMIELMREHEGIGLAAPQVGLPIRVFVADVPQRRAEEAPQGVGEDPGLPTSTKGARVYINPVLSELRGPLEGYEEGCLSLPDITGDVQRPPMVTVTARDVEGQEFTEQGAGLLARCWQHEHDHLDGVLILDKMMHASRLKMRAAIRRLERGG